MLDGRRDGALLEFVIGVEEQEQLPPSFIDAPQTLAKEAFSWSF